MSVTAPLSFENWVADGVHTYRHVAGDEPIVPDTGRGRYVDHGALGAYLEFVWRLTERRARYAVPRYYGADAEPFALVNWEYEVENEESDELGAIRGFVPARPLEGAEAGFYGLETIASLRDAVHGLIGDERAELNLYALQPGTAARVVDALRSETAPQLGDVLGPTDVFVDLAVGVDIGYRDVLVVHSKRELVHEIEREQ